MAAERLALHGGSPVSEDPWPAWPRVSSGDLKAVEDCLQSGVWAISGRSTGRPLEVESFRDEFAAFVKREWCVETDHGTSALVTALEALGVGPGDDVIVPVLTWVACASAVLEVGAVPVFVDVDPESLCLDPAQVAARLTARTKCILVVHASCTAADMPALEHVSRVAGVPIVEDCAQSHGAVWADGQAIGSHGVLAVYSFQNGKPLTAGEGGAVVGSDRSLRLRVESARADTRVLDSQDVAAGEMFLRESGELMGANHCMPELAAALLRQGLKRLPDEVRLRDRNASLLDAGLSDAGFGVIRRNDALSVRSVYEYGVLWDVDDVAEGKGWVETALQAELGLPVYEMDPPIHQSRLFKPRSKPRFASFYKESFSAGEFPVAERAHRRLFMIHHSALIVDDERMSEIVRAFVKVRGVCSG